jgi:uncharacterized protein (UPF0335 family)
MDGDLGNDNSSTVTQRLMRQLLERVGKLSEEKRQLELELELARQENGLLRTAAGR